METRSKRRRRNSYEQKQLAIEPASMSTDFIANSQLAVEPVSMSTDFIANSQLAIEPASMSTDFIANSQLAIEPASISTDFIANSTNESSVEEPKNILSQLNDDCIMKLFEYLRLRDLCIVADVCSKFTSIAISAFKKRYVVLDLNDILDEEECDVDDSYTMKSWESIGSLDSFDNILTGTVASPSSLSTMQIVRILFRRFGIYIQTVCMRVDDEDQLIEIFELMSTYCMQEDAKLNKLILHNTDITEDVAQRFQPLFDHLQSLDVTGGSVCLDVGAELTELMLEDLSLDEIGTSKLDKLQALSLVDIQRNCFGRRGPCRMSMMLLPHLKRLTVIGECYFTFMDNLLLCVGMSQLLELEELKLDVEFDPRNVRNVRDLARLQHLKVFDLNCRWYSITALLSNFVEQSVPIEELHLRRIVIDYTSATHLAKLSTIRKLCLSDGGWNFDYENMRLANVVKGMPMLQKLLLCDFGSITIKGIKTTIANAPKLSEFHLDFGPPHDGKYIIREQEFIEICEIIAKRLVYTQLNMIISGNQCVVAVPDDVVKKNRVWLDIKIINSKKFDVEPIDIIDHYGLSDDDDENLSDDEVFLN